MKLKFGALWFNNKPTLLQYISWNSYIKHGHELNIFLYDMSIEVPEGAIKRDANDIILQKDIVLPKIASINGNGESQFSDIFRIHMIKKEKLVWTDSDVVCLSDEWPDPDPYLFGSINNFKIDSSGAAGVNGDILYINNEGILNKILEELEYIPKNFYNNKGLIGPNLLSLIFLENNIIHMAKEEKIFHAINFDSIASFLNPEEKNRILELTSNSLAISLFHSFWAKNKLIIPSINDEPKDDYLGYLTKKYIKSSL